MKFVANSNRQRSSDAGLVVKLVTGQQALGDLFVFLEKSGLRLDALNRQHCCTFLAASKNGKVGTVPAAMRAQVVADRPNRRV